MNPSFGQTAHASPLVLPFSISQPPRLQLIECQQLGMCQLIPRAGLVGRIGENSH